MRLVSVFTVWVLVGLFQPPQTNPRLYVFVLYFHTQNGEMELQPQHEKQARDLEEHPQALENSPSRNVKVLPSASVVCAEARPQKNG